MSDTIKLPPPISNDDYLDSCAIADVRFAQLDVNHPAYLYVYEARRIELAKAQQEHGDVTRAPVMTIERFISSWHRRQQEAYEASKEESPSAMFMADFARPSK